MLEQLFDHLPREHPWRENIHIFDCLNSTNVYARELAQKGAPHGTVILANRQTGGKGRMGRSFHSPAGMGVYMTVILRPRCAATQLMHLTCATAVAMCDAVYEAAALQPGIKWTNDLVVNGKKLGGILTELALEQNGVAYALIGVGVNCSGSNRDFPAELQDMVTTVSAAAGKQVCRGRLAAGMISALAQMDKELLSEKAACMSRYRKNCITLGQEISLVNARQVRHAKALDVDDDGALLVELPDGSKEWISSGEVSVRGMYGYAK